MFAGLIKKAISLSSKEKFEEIYFHEDRKTKRSKNFVFSVFMKGYELKEEHFEVSGKLKCIISSSDSELMLYIYNGLLELQEFRYKGYELVQDRVNFLEEKFPTSSEVVFKTLSPIAMKNKSGRFIAPDDSEYNQNLNYIANEVLQSARGDGLKEPLVLVPLEMKKQVVKLKHQEFAGLNAKQTLYVNAYRGVFRLKGNPEDLILLVQNGIGFRRNQGFGNVQLLEG